MFSLKPNKADSSAPKRGRLPFNIAFKPDIRASARPIGESTRLFVKLIGMLFAMNGLFPKDHPALVPNSEMPLSLHEVIRTGWNSFSMTEKDAPKALFFFAAVGCMAITTLMVIIGLFSLFVGTAHAQSKFFTPPANDMAQQWIDYLFKGKPLTSYYDQAKSNVANITQTGNLNIQCSMIIALGFYSDAVLLVAALILFYHLAWMVVETAHHGKVMGQRGNQIWAPIRLVVAVGLLVPISNNPPPQCPANSGAGLNSAQYITIKIAELGSALASNVWITFINAIQAAKIGFVPPSTPQVETIVRNIFLMEGCAAAWNFHATTNLPPPDLINLPPATGDTTSQNIGTVYNYTSTITNEQDACGDIVVRAPPETSASDVGPMDDIVPIQTKVYQDIYKAHADTLEYMLPEIRDMASHDIAFMDGEMKAVNEGDDNAPVNDDFQKAVNDYYQKLNQNLSAAYAGMKDDLKTQVFTTAGWITAGTWMNTISRDQANIANAVYDGIPSTAKPKPEQITDSSVAQATADDLEEFQTWLKHGHNPAVSQASTVSPCDLQAGAMGANAGKRQWNTDTGSIFTELMKMVDKVAVNNQVWSDENYANCTTTNGVAPFSLGLQFNTTNPFGELTALGHRSIRTAIQVFNDLMMLMGLNAISGGLNGLFTAMSQKFDPMDKSRAKAIADAASGLSGMVQGATSAVLPIFSLLIAVFFTIGVTLGFILPLIPFMHFFFASVAWGLVLLEAIIAMPLVALAHLNPEGDGLPGNMARQAYFMLLGLFLRPTMIIFALITSLLIFFLSMFLLNKLFAATVVGTLGTGQGFYTLTRIVYTIIYVFLAYTCAVNCFKIIDSLPESVFRWINISLGHQQIANAGQTLQSAGGLVTGYATSQGMQALQGAGAGVTKAVDGALQAAPNAGKAIGIGKPGG